MSNNVVNKKSDIKGMSLVELMVTVSLIPVVLGSVMMLYLSGNDVYETGSAYVTAETALQMKLDEITDELAETAETNLNIYSWTDAQLGPQEAFCFSSARDTQGVFRTVNGRPDWQSVVVIAPFSQSQRGKIVRYQSYGTYVFPINIVNITDTQIILSNGLVFNRDAGAAIMGNVSSLDAQALQISLQNPISVAIKVKVYLPKGEIREVSLQSYVDCRNANEAGAGGLYDE